MLQIAKCDKCRGVGKILNMPCHHCWGKGYFYSYLEPVENGPLEKQTDSKMGETIVTVYNIEKWRREPIEFVDVVRDSDGQPVELHEDEARLVIHLHLPKTHYYVLRSI